jgi:hypothetical protein
MRYTILLVCADKMLLDTRSLVLEIAGYRTLRASTLMSGLGLAFCCNLVVIDTTYSDDQQEEFLARLHDENPKISLLRRDTSVTALESLTETVKKVLALGSPTDWQPNNQPRCCAELREAVWLFAQPILRRCCKDLSGH